MAEPDLASRIAYRFREPRLLRQALTHRSHGADHNERLEFVGDGVLNCVVAAALYRRFPELPEGDLSRVRASLVNQPTLAALAAEIGIGPELLLGEGEARSGGAERPSILADAFEAVIGAVFVDGGYAPAERAVEALFASRLDGLDPARLAKDPKTRLQEWLQGRRMSLPEYSVVRVSGEAHAQTFEVCCRVAELDLAIAGSGASRRAAEQAAAVLVLDRIEHD